MTETTTAQIPQQATGQHDEVPTLSHNLCQPPSHLGDKQFTCAGLADDVTTFACTGTAHTMGAQIVCTCVCHLIVDVDDRDLGMFGAAGTATFDHTRTYRYTLERRWGSGPGMCFLMLNPSTADAFELDPTLHRCVRIAKHRGAGALTVVNLFALRSTDPRALYTHDDPIGPANDDAILTAAHDACWVIAAWGTHGDLRGRGREVSEMLHGLDNVYRLGEPLTSNGQPRHPLGRGKGHIPVTTPLVEHVA